MLIQIHILQNYQPSNLNRDDTGSPKDAMFGGVLRGRISSQCLKRSIRKSQTFKDAFEQTGLLGERTKQLPLLIQQELTALGANEKSIKDIVARVPEIGRESKKRTEAADEEDDGADEAENAQEQMGETAQLIFIDRKNEARPLAEKLLEAYNKLGAQKWNDTKKTKISDIIKELGERAPRSVDIAMFGRMTTSQAFRDVHASVQVTHALSTNALKQEFDYYTAMDDLQPDTEPGADMIGDIEFNSCTYYKYVNVHWEGLLKNLGDDKEVARHAVAALLQAAATAHPTGKQNSFAAFNLPDFVLVEVSERNLPISYANAFLKPVRGMSDETLMDNSIAALQTYATKLSRAYNLTPERAHLAVNDQTFLGADGAASLDDLGKWAASKLPNA